MDINNNEKEAPVGASFHPEGSNDVVHWPTGSNTVGRVVFVSSASPLRVTNRHSRYRAGTSVLLQNGHRGAGVGDRHAGKPRTPVRYSTRSFAFAACTLCHCMF